MTSFIVGILVLGIIALIAGFLLPSQVHVERQTLINASPEQVFARISDFNAWSDWSPWAKMDPDAELEIQGSGVGQTMKWSSENRNVGKGSQQITQLNAPHQLKANLDFEEMGKSDVSFTLEPIEDKTKVTWSYDSDMRAGVPLVKQPIYTFFGFFIDSMLGKTYEKGLSNLKTVVETA